MKTKAPAKSPAASRAKKLPPDDGDLKKLLGRAYPPLAKVVAWLRATEPAVAVDERFPAQSGWHRIYLLKKRRLFYLAPKPGDFRFALILGDKAVARLRDGEIADQFLALLKGAKHYAEGTAFIFDQKTFDPVLVIALLEAKLAR